MQAFIFAVTSGADVWEIDLGSSKALVVDAKLIQFTSPQSPLVQEAEPENDAIERDIDVISDDWDEAQLAEDEDIASASDNELEPEV